MTNYAKFLGWMAGLVFTYLFLMFVFVNIIVGCKSWDSDYWTPNSFCITPVEIVKSHF